MNDATITLEIPSQPEIDLEVNQTELNIELNSPDNLTELTHRAEAAAELAKESAAYVEEVIANFEGGDLVQSVDEVDGEIIVTKANGSTNKIKLPMQFVVKILGDSEV